MSELKTGSNIDLHPKAKPSLQSRFNKFISKPSGKIALVLIVVVLIGLVALIAYDQILRNSEDANASFCTPEQIALQTCSGPLRRTRSSTWW